MFSAHDLEEHRPALTGHCYRMTGSVADADDAVQETMVRAWRSLERFEGRASLRTWLYRIATRVCLDALADRSRRVRPIEVGPVGTVDDELTVLPASQWIEPIPDATALPADADPSQRAVLRESIRLAFVAALQHLPARQRAALLLTEVLDWSAAEVAECLDTSVACGEQRAPARPGDARHPRSRRQPAAAVGSAGDAGRSLRRRLRALRRGRARPVAPRGCRPLDAAVRPLAARARGDPHLAPRPRGRAAAARAWCRRPRAASRPSDSTVRADRGAATGRGRSSSSRSRATA